MELRKGKGKGKNKAKEFSWIGRLSDILCNPHLNPNYILLFSCDLLRCPATPQIEIQLVERLQRADQGLVGVTIDSEMLDMSECRTGEKPEMRKVAVDGFGAEDI